MPIKYDRVFVDGLGFTLLRLDGEIVVWCHERCWVQRARIAHLENLDPPWWGCFRPIDLAVAWDCSLTVAKPLSDWIAETVRSWDA